jgi:uncharacterized protein YcbX
MPHLARITLYPIKALDGLDVPEVRVLPSGALWNNRCLAIADRYDRFVTGKRNAKVHLIRARYDLPSGTVSVTAPGHAEARSYHLDRDRDALASWLSEFFEQPVHLVENAEVGFPDDTESLGPTIVSAGTWQEVASWFEGLGAEETRLRFRANLEIGGTEPFWEERLYGEPEEVVRFQVGEVVFEGTYPCQRCVVPTRHPQTADPLPDFMNEFMEKRAERLPSWAARSRFDHFYRLAVNTRLAGPTGGTIRVGDSVAILGRAPS